LAVTAPQRLALHAAARAALREEEGDTLVSAQLAEVEARMEAQIERTGSRTLRWTVGTMLAGNAAVVGLLTLTLR
jgi:hypothetical protein